MTTAPDAPPPGKPQAPCRHIPAPVRHHPFVSRLLEIGVPRLAKAAPKREATPRREPAPPLASLAAASRTSLADINPPPLPQAFLALRRAAEDPYSTVASLAGIIAMDPSLASYVLRLANSALYSLPYRVETVSRAIGCIGLSEIQTMAAGAALGRLFKEPPRPDILAMPDFWRHAAAVGLLARTLAERINGQSRERYFVAGLLHDMGKLLLAIAEPDLAAMALARAVADPSCPSPIASAEQEVLGFDHATLGGRVCRKWQLPESLTEAVACHHAPDRCPDNAMAAAVHVADFMANALGLRATPGVGQPECDVSALAVFGLTDSDPPELLDALEAGLESMTSLFAS